MIIYDGSKKGQSLGLSLGQAEKGHFLRRALGSPIVSGPTTGLWPLGPSSTRASDAVPQFTNRTWATKGTFGVFKVKGQYNHF